jgi:ABC-2 type transport system ATP-binding protein
MQKRPPASIEVNRLDFRYPGAERAALTEVGFRIAPGERVGLLGPNGAGKSTLMRILCGYLPPQDAEGGAGSVVQVAGLDLREDSLAVRQQVGYLPELVPLYPELRVREHLDFRAAIKGVRRSGRAAECRRVSEATGLLDMFDTPISKLSRGYRQRVGIADALLGAPPLVVLDEPTVGLDPNQIQAIRSMLGELGGEQTLVFSSHVLAEVEQLCDRILILSRGRLVADESVRQALSGGLILELACEEGPGRQLVAGVLAAMGADDEEGSGEAVEGASIVSETLVDRVRITVPGQALPDQRADASFSNGGGREGALALALGHAALDAGIAILRLESGRRRLEDRFARATGFGD